MERDPQLRAELAVFLADAREFDRWLGALPPGDRVRIELAVARDPDLREEVGVLIAGMCPSLRRAFLRSFRRAVVSPGPLSPVLEGLRGVASELRNERHKDADDAA